MYPHIHAQSRPATSREDHRGKSPGSRRVALRKRFDRFGDDGVTMIEVLVATIVLLVTMIPMGFLLTSVSSASAQARQHEGALQLADSWVEILSNSQPPTASGGSVLTNVPETPTAPAGISAPSNTLAGTTYSVTAAYTENDVDDLAQSDLCSAGQPPSPTHPGVIQLQVVVTWDNGGQTLVDTTEINYPKPGLQTEGFLAINLTNDGETDINGNAANQRLQALPVTITQTSGTPTLSPNPYTLYPDPNGCIFAQVPVGTYNISIQQPTAGTPPLFNGYSGAPPFVNTSGSTDDEVDNQTITVTAEQTVNMVAFDEGITTSISYGGPSAVDNGITCPNTPSIQCITTGDGATGASAAWGSGYSAWTATNLAAGTQINQVDCTTAYSPYCVGVGYGPSGGLIETTASDFSSLTADSVPSGVTDLTQVNCPSNTGCYALGLSTTGPVLLAGHVGSGTDTWINVPLSGVGSLNSIACPTSTVCEVSYTSTSGSPGVMRLGGDPGLAGFPLWSPSQTSDSLPSTAPDVVTSVGTITCPTATTCLAIATGDQASPTDATVITAPIAAIGASTWISETTFPTGAASVTGLSCTSTTCVAIGTATGAAAVWTGDITGATHAWAQATNFPSSVLAVTSVACGYPAPNNTADCAVAATTANPSGAGQLLDGSLTNGSWVWNSANIPANENLQYLIGVACMYQNGSLSTTCAAVGASPAGSVILTSPTGPTGVWSNQTPTSLDGSVVLGIPLEIAPSGTSSWTTQVQSSTTTAANATTLGPPLYPFAPGYSIAAGDCPAEAISTAIANLNAPPGGNAQVTVPLGLVPLELVNSSGAPVSGATITLTSTVCGGSADFYNLPLTDATGVTMASVPYGTYSYTVTQGSSAVAHTAVTLTIGASTIQVATGGSTVTNYLPALTQVQA